MGTSVLSGHFSFQVDLGGGGGAMSVLGIYIATIIRLITRHEYFHLFLVHMEVLPV